MSRGQSARNARRPAHARAGIGGDGGESNSPSRGLLQGPLRACPTICRRSVGRPSAGYRPLQSRPLSGFSLGYATLPEAASPLNDASTARGDEAASTLTLPPKRRGREQAGGCQLLRFAACLTRPDGTSARVPWESGPVETTHPHDPGTIPGTSILRPDDLSAKPSARAGSGPEDRRASRGYPARRPRPALGPSRPLPASAISRSSSRRASRAAISRRRSCSCLPRARPSSILARPRELM